MAMRERFLHLLLTSVGHKVVVTLQSGVTLAGVLYTATPFQTVTANQSNKYILKAVTNVTSSSTTDAATDMYANGSTVVLDMGDVTSLVIPSLRLENNNNNTAAAGADVQTDTDISAAAGANAGPRELVEASSAWTSGGGKASSRADGLLDGGSAAARGPAPLKGSIDGWDQFKANQELFNVKGSYDENLYTTALDKTKMSSDKMKKAERIAQEIQSQVSTNMHVAEERGQAIEGDYDEEDRYSGVLKNKEADVAAAGGTGGGGAPKKVMNYAAAAAAKKKDAAAPPGFGGKSAEGAKKPVAEEAAKETKATEAPKKETAETPAAPVATEKKEEVKEEKKEAKSSKLSATAKSFSLSIKAKEWTPTFGAPAAEPAPVPQSQPQPQYMPQPGMVQPGTLRLIVFECVVLLVTP